MHYCRLSQLSCLDSSAGGASICGAPAARRGERRPGGARWPRGNAPRGSVGPVLPRRQGSSPHLRHDTGLTRFVQPQGPGSLYRIQGTRIAPPAPTLPICRRGSPSRRASNGDSAEHTSTANRNLNHSATDLFNLLNNGNNLSSCVPLSRLSHAPSLPRHRVTHQHTQCGTALSVGPLGTPARVPSRPHSEPNQYSRRGSPTLVICRPRERTRG